MEKWCQCSVYLILINYNLYFFFLYFNLFQLYIVGNYYLQLLFFRVHRNLKTVVYTTAIKKGDIDNWHFLWNKNNATNVVSERMEIFNALSCSPHYEILDK